MKTFKLYNRTLGWVVFLIAATTYLLTAEPTVSLWDCGEFIASAFKLQVGHPPGAPFFMILARVFTLFAGDDLSNVAFMVNAMSALASAFTIMFLFWTITHLGLKITGRDNIKPYQIVAVLGSGLVGALAYTFSDTFWFSAVEGEVYASSSFFTAIVFWAVLKWENTADEKYANRWLVLIAYLCGLSIGVHLLNLLAIPAIVLVYYFRKFEVTRKGIIRSLLIGGAILGGVMYVVIPGVVKLAAIFELLFVNTIGLPYNSGLIFYSFALMAGLFYAVYYTHKHNKQIWNTAWLMLTVIVIGYSSYAMIVIRSAANPPMDENSPETIFKLQSYLNREQYGDRPLVYGQYFNAPLVDTDEGKKYWTRKIKKNENEKDEYLITNYKTEYTYDKNFNGFFPRMWSSSNAQHVTEYMEWAKMQEKVLYQPKRDNEGNFVQNKQTGKFEYDRSRPKNKPTMIQNIRYLIRYQVGHMYLRYFMWNFAGRQDDVQSHGSILNGNWITGIPFIDKIRLGADESLMPDEVKNHAARNKYYLLPLILGFIGLFFHLKKHIKDFWVVMALFILTGLAIVVYLNQYPLQPRERDYAYAGSFYAFAIWIGLGVFGIIDLLGKAFKNVPATITVTGLCLLLVPGIMAKENWDDHDRSGRYTALDIARNYLESCAPNAILFTNGDNDTFPLWYAQEVEGIRTDVRIVNLMLLNMDWYADQMKLKAYESEPLPITLSHEAYLDGTRDMVFIQPDNRVKGAVEASKIVEFVASDNPQTKVTTNDGRQFDVVPARNFVIPVDSAKVIANGTVKEKDAHLIEPMLFGKFSGSRMTKSDLVAFDIIANNNWERPIYYVSTGHSGTFGLESYLQLEGFAYRLVPIRTSGGYPGRIDTDLLYDNLMNKFSYGRMNEDDVYLDHFHLRTLNVIRFRIRFNRLATALIAEGDNKRAEEVLDKVVELTPHNKVPYDYFTIGLAESYYKINKFDKGNAIVEKIIDISQNHLDYYAAMSNRNMVNLSQEIQMNFQIINSAARLAGQFNQTEIAEDATAYTELVWPRIKFIFGQ